MRRRRSILVAGLEAVGEDPDPVVAAALALLDEARAVGVHAGEGLAQGTGEFGLADAVVAVLVHLALSLAMARAVDDVRSGDGGAATDDLAHLAVGAGMAQLEAVAVAFPVR